MKVYYNDRGFQLGNLLFVLMQAHKDRLAGIEESYVLRTGYFKFAQSFFPKTAELFGKAQGCELEPFDYYQVSGQDYDSDVLDSFCREYLLERVEELSNQFDNKNITIAIRRTDFLDGDRAEKYGYDAVKYVVDCLEIIKEKEGDISDLTIRITSDDTTWCKEELAPKLKVLFSFSNEIVVEEQDIQDNFLQLYATDKYFITPNSTYGYWVGYVLRVSARNVQTFAPNFNTTLIEDGRQIADTRDWILVDVDRSMYEGKE